MNADAQKELLAELRSISFKYGESHLQQNAATNLSLSSLSPPQTAQPISSPSPTNLSMQGQINDATSKKKGDNERTTDDETMITYKPTKLIIAVT